MKKVSIDLNIFSSTNFVFSQNVQVVMKLNIFFFTFQLQIVKFFGCEEQLEDMITDSFKFTLV